MHPLKAAMDAVGITQQQLADKVTAMRLMRGNGDRLTLSQNYLSEILRGAKVPHPDIAKAISCALQGAVDPADILLYEAA